MTIAQRRANATGATLSAQTWLRQAGDALVEGEDDSKVHDLVDAAARAAITAREELAEAIREEGEDA